MDVKEELSRKAETSGKEVKLTKSMSIADMIKAMQPEIKKALPEILTPERFTRMAISALNITPQLKECEPRSFLAALMNAAQLGLEPNTPLGQAYLIPFKNRKNGMVECQFVIGYKGLLDLCYRNNMVQSIQDQAVYENDFFEYELGLNPKLIHRPELEERGSIRLFYGVFKLTNGGFGFEVLSKTGMDEFARKHSRSIDSAVSPWQTDYEAMAKKTMVKKVLRYAPMKTEVARALVNDNTVKIDLASDMSEVENQAIFDMEEME